MPIISIRISEITSGKKPPSVNLYSVEDKYRSSIPPNTMKNREINNMLVFHMKSIMIVTISVVINITKTTAIPALRVDDL